MKRAIPIILIVIVAAAVWFFFSRHKNGEEQAPQFTTVSPQRGTIRNTVAASGSVTSNLDVEIKCKASGEIINLPFDISDHVSEGDLLLELDPSDEQRNVELAQVNLRESQARLSKADENVDVARMNLQASYDLAEADINTTEAQAGVTEQNTERTRQLHELGFISDQEYEQALADLQVSQNQVDSAEVRYNNLDADAASVDLMEKDVAIASASVESSRISLENALQRLDDTRVYSPVDGIVTAKFVQTGQIISSGISTTTGGTTVMTISDFSRLFINASVDESFIGQVETGQRVIISVDAFPDQNFEGVVDRISPVGENVSNVVTFETRIEVTSDNKNLLMPQMTADVEIVVAEKENVLMVPTGALHREGPNYYVMVADGGGAGERRDVVTGINDGNNVEIVSGLTESDIVLVSQSTESSAWSRGGFPRGGPPPGMMIRH
jgi:HlyD family secretion protein